MIAKCEICMLKCIQLRILYNLVFAMFCFQSILIPGLVLGIVTKYIYIQGSSINVVLYIRASVRFIT